MAVFLPLPSPYNPGIIFPTPVGTMSKFINLLGKSIESHTLSFVFLIFFLLCLFFLWLFLKRREKNRITLAAGGGEGDLESIPLFNLENPTPKDEQALLIIEKYRKDIWYKTSSTMVMKSVELLHLVEKLASDIARIYHPDISEPMYEASIMDILGLIGRANDKIRFNAREFPFNLVANRRISDVLKMKDFYKTIRQNPVLETVMKNRAALKVGKVLWSAYNTSNPWYWSRKIAYKASREAGLRYFYTLLVSQVGEESLRVYSGRNIRNPETVQELLIATEMLNVALVGGGDVTAEEYEKVIGFVLGSKKLDSKDKLDLIRSLINKKRLKSQDLGALDSEKVRSLFTKKLEEVASGDDRFTDEKKEYISKLEKKLHK